jgi:hypothetical protein
VTATNPRPIVSATEWMTAFRAANKRSLKPSTVAVAWVLHSYAGWADGGRIYPSARTIGTGAGIGRDTAGIALKELAALGWIELVSETGRGGVKTHRLTLPDMWETPTPEMWEAPTSVVGVPDMGCRIRPHNPVVDPVVIPQPIDSALHVATGARVDPWDEAHVRPEPQRTKPTARTGSRRIGSPW